MSSFVATQNFYDKNTAKSSTEADFSEFVGLHELDTIIRCDSNRFSCFSVGLRLLHCNSQDICTCSTVGEFETMLSDIEVLIEVNFSAQVCCKWHFQYRLECIYLIRPTSERELIL
jgi:hypothetical protein